MMPNSALSTQHSALAGPMGGDLTYPGDLSPPAETLHSLARLSRYATYRAFYAADQWARRPAPGERRLTINYARAFVNKAASYLLGKPVGYDASPTNNTRGGKRASEAARSVEAWIGEVADFNDLAALDLETAISAGTLGDGAWTVRWDAQSGYPRVTAVDPTGLTCRWRTDDVRALLWVKQAYWLTPAELTPPQAARLGRAPNSPYETLQAVELWTAKEWSLTVGGAKVDGGPNPYGVIPYIVFPNIRVPQEFWGDSDLVDLLELQQDLNARISTFARILDVAGNPVAVITGADEASTESLKLGPNQLWTLPEGAKAEVLDLLKSGGAAAHLDYIGLIYRAMHDVSEMPRTSFGDGAGTARSGVALEIELQPLLHKLARKRAILGPALTQRAQLLLTVARLHGAKLAPVVLRAAWPPVLPQDRQALVSQESQLVSAGIHPPTVAMGLLNDPDPEAQFQQVLREAAALQAVGLLARPRPTADSPPPGAGQTTTETAGVGA